jgi:flagellar protein FliO/FliZ
VVALVIRVVLSLAVVLGLLWLVARTSSRRFGGPGRSMVRVVARQPLARAASLAVVEVGDRVLVVGVSENGVSLLTELDPSELPVAQIELDPLETDALEAGEARPGQHRAPVTPTPVAGLNGSLLSARTWRQAWAAATARDGTTGG